jgi:hypothetical protein
MTMHLLPPMYSTTGKKKGKAKFRTAAQALKARMNAESWQALLDKYEIKDAATKVRPTARVATTSGYSPAHDPKRSTRHIPSLDTGQGLAARPADKVYTGDAMLGVSVLHKSNGIPVFRQEDAIDISKMRRG